MNAIADSRPGGHLLVVDDEDNVLNALTRVLRRDGYTLHIARSVTEAFEILALQPIQVVLSDQRMPEKNGTVFLSEVKDKYPSTVRLMLSGYTEVGAVTDAINQGAIYKFLTKPWDDEQLRANIREAFQRCEIESQNQRLRKQVEDVNAELMQLNHRLEQQLQARNQRIDRDSSVVGVMQEIIDHLPLGVIGIDQGGELVWVNEQAAELLGLNPVSLIGASLVDLPEQLSHVLRDCLMAEGFKAFSSEIELDGHPLRVDVKPMGVRSNSSGCLVVLQSSSGSSS